MSKANSILVKVAIVAALASTVAACASKPPPAPPAPAAPPAPPPPPPAPPPAPAPVAPPAPTGPVPGSEQDFTVNVGDRVYFDYDQYSIRQDGKAVLSAQAAWLVKYPRVNVRIEGNADERGTREYNLALGARRAESVKSFLVSAGVADARITTISYGKEKPVDTGTGEDAWAHNRNGHTALVSGSN